MNYVAQSHPAWRCPRVQLADITPAVLRMPDGSGSRAILNTISLTGGLLSISSTLNRGSRIELLFVTPAGPVLGAAEMLSAISMTQQPFRFVSLEESAQRRLRAVIQSYLQPVPDAWITKYRAALDRRNPPRRRTFAIVLGALALAILGLGSAAWWLQILR
ncbi:MAG TPA: hypothetical protein VN810_01585 [Terriglobales bacterium]|nr:hypothetical protein [Terriglobales bacterium]